MEDLNYNKKEVIVFSEDISSVVSEILGEYGLGESEEDAFQKIKNGQPTNGGLLAEIIKKISYKEIDAKNIPITLKENFNLPTEKIKKLEKDIEEKILSKVRSVVIEEEKKDEIRLSEPLLKKTELSTPAKKIGHDKTDAYREPTE